MKQIERQEVYKAFFSSGDDINDNKNDKKQ